MIQIKYHRHVRHWLIALALLTLGFAGCTVKYVSDYDAVIDKETTALHKKLDAFLVQIQSEPDQEKRKYKHHQDFYNEVLVDLNALQVRAGAIYKNKITEEQLELVEQNIGLLVLLHKGATDSNELTERQKREIQTKGVATTGTSEELDHGLNPALVPVVRNLFNTQFGAIMKFELAKQRGENVSSNK